MLIDLHNRKKGFIFASSITNRKNMKAYGMFKKDWNETEDYGRFNAAMADEKRNKNACTKKRIKKTLKARERKFNKIY